MVVTVPLQKQIEPHKCQKARNLNILVDHTLRELQMDGGALRLDGDAVVKAFTEQTQTQQHDFKIAYICAHEVIVDNQQQKSTRPLSLVRIGLAESKAAPIAAFKDALAVLDHLKKSGIGTFGPGGLTDPRTLNTDPDMVYFYQREVRSQVTAVGHGSIRF